MKKIIVLVMLVLAAGLVYAAERAGMPVSVMPEIKEAKGTSDASIAAAVYPKITVYPDPATSMAGCQEVVGALEGKPVPESAGKFEIMDGLVKAVKINPDYLSSTKILVAWTVRIEGICPEYRIWPKFCNPYHGGVQFDCPSGLVDTQMYLKTDPKGSAEPKGAVFSLEMPGTSKTVSQPNDPTITGTYLISPGDFPGGKLPAEIEIQVWWRNRSSMTITSPKGMRTLTVHIMPTTRSDK